MKKSILLSTIVGLMLFGCNNQATEKHDDSHNTEHHEDHNHDHDGSEALELNNGEKWKVNEEMKPFIEKAESELKTYISSKGTDYKKLAEKQAEVNTSLIKSCTMDGKSHDELHKWLHPHLELVEELANTENESDAATIVTKLEQSFATFHEFFQ